MSYYIDRKIHMTLAQQFTGGSWSRGYDVALTRRRSPVRIRASPLFLKFRVLMGFSGFKKFIGSIMASEKQFLESYFRNIQLLLKILMCKSTLLRLFFAEISFLKVDSEYVPDCSMWNIERGAYITIGKFSVECSRRLRFQESKKKRRDEVQ